MNPTVLATLVIAALAVLGAIGSVLALSFRVGRMIGVVTGYMTAATDDRAHIWRELGSLAERFYTHISSHDGQGSGVGHDG